jgi:hypothetical protein
MGDLVAEVSEQGLLGDVTALEAKLEFLVRRVEGRLLIRSDQRMSDLASSVTGVLDSPTSVQMSFSELRKIVREEIELAITPLKTTFSPSRTPGSRIGGVEGIVPFDMMSRVQPDSPANFTSRESLVYDSDADESKSEYELMFYSKPFIL